MRKFTFLSVFCLVALPLNPLQKARADTSFLWGVANSSFQVEGSPADSDAYRWTHTQGAIKDGTNADVATDFWNRYDEDFALAQGLSANAFRISIAWERIEPEQGVWNEEAFQHYELILNDMRSHGLEPVVTLFHSAMPIWLADRGGVLAPDFGERFAEYALETTRRLSGGTTQVHYWLTLNEPVTYAEGKYIDGGGYKASKMAPFKFLHAIQAQIRAHILAFNAIHSMGDPLIKVGVASDWDDFEISGKGFLSHIVHFFSNQVYNLYFLDGILKGHSSLCIGGNDDFLCHHFSLLEGRGALDFLGINYYSRELIQSGWKPPFVTMEAGVYAKGIENALISASKFGLPLMVTENGVADSSDLIRPEFLRDHIAALDEVRKVLPVPLLGYLHWSLTDNFEWSSGFSERYGLVAIDYNTLTRTPRSSYGVYRDLIQAHQR
jgi:beta-glucosidase